MQTFDAPTLERELRALADRLHLKAGALFTLLREALTAKAVTPPLFETIAVLGRERTLARLDQAAQTLRERVVM